MTHAVRMLMLVGLIVCSTPTLVLGVGKILSLSEEYRIPEVTCSADVPRITHTYTKDGRATYAMPGVCRGNSDDGIPRRVGFHVDAVWIPGEEIAHETGRIYDLGSIWPMFQPGGATIFINRYQCKGGDPWLSDARCGLLGSTAGDELKRVFPRLTQTPYPLMKVAIPVSQRAALKAEYQRVINPMAAAVVPLPSDALRKGVLSAKPAPGSPPPPPPPPPPPKYGASYAPASIQSLRKGKTATVQVKVTNTGKFPWGANSAFKLSYHWYRGASAIQIGGEQTSLPQAVNPNQPVTVQAKVKAPSNAGTYTLRWDMLQQGVTWFSQKGVATRDQTVVVK